jgi:tetratricopeptide (TPR) repeat protein
VSPLACPACGAEYDPPARDAGPTSPEGSCAACGADLLPVRCAAAAQEAALRQGAAALRAGHYRAALSALSQAAVFAPASSPSGSRLRLLRGLALIGAGRIAAARTDLDGSEVWARLAPHLGEAAAAEARYGEARALAAAGALPEAQALLSSGPLLGDGLVLLALCALRDGRRGRAEAALRAALAADPSNFQAAALLGTALGDKL